MSGPQPFVFQAGADVKRHAPATERNRDVITKTLARLLPAEGLVLEVASGTGEHVVHFGNQATQTPLPLRQSTLGGRSPTCRMCDLRCCWTRRQIGRYRRRTL